MKFDDPRLPSRFWDKVLPEPMSGCWLWVGSLSTSGYGCFAVNRATKQAHRLAYLALCGAIANGLELDHLCRQRCCVNPDHLEPVTHAENVRRSPLMSRLGMMQTSKSECPLGHAYSGDNLYIQPTTGHRRCRECARASDRRRGQCS